MGCLKPCHSVVGGSIEIAEIAMYDEPTAQAGPPGFDDLLGEPFLEDGDGDGLGERVRPETLVEVKAKAKWTRYEEQSQDQTGNAPNSFLTLTLFQRDLEALGLIVSGKCRLRPNDRLLKIKSMGGVVRVDMEAGGRDGMHCFEVRPGETGTGIWLAMFENRRPVSR